MAGFLSSDQITKVQNLADTLHTTFARTITVYKNAKKTLIASNSSWNSLYGRTNTGSDSSVEYSTESQTFQARIYYDDMDTSYLTDDGPADQIRRPPVDCPDTARADTASPIRNN